MRALYLDQDVLVQKDLAALWDIDLEGHPIAAARECCVALPKAVADHDRLL